MSQGESGVTEMHFKYSLTITSRTHPTQLKQRKYETRSGSLHRTLENFERFYASYLELRRPRASSGRLGRGAEEDGDIEDIRKYILRFSGFREEYLTTGGPGGSTWLPERWQFSSSQNEDDALLRGSSRSSSMQMFPSGSSIVPQFRSGTVELSCVEDEEHRRHWRCMMNKTSEFRPP